MCHLAWEGLHELRVDLAWDKFWLLLYGTAHLHEHLTTSTQKLKFGPCREGLKSSYKQFEHSSCNPDLIFNRFSVPGMAEWSS